MNEQRKKEANKHQNKQKRRKKKGKKKEKKKKEKMNHQYVDEGRMMRVRMDAWTAFHMHPVLQQVAECFTPDDWAVLYLYRAELNLSMLERASTNVEIWKTTPLLIRLSRHFTDEAWTQVLSIGHQI